MYAIVGTVPDPSFPLTAAPVTMRDNQLKCGDMAINVNRGTPALIAASLKVGEVLNLEAPIAFLAGDTGIGKGSRELYAFLESELGSFGLSILCFHYLQPDVDWHFRILESIRSSGSSPVLIADAGFMYAAKMSGDAEEYDLFTPDVGELAFLADEKAPHPFYTRGFILHEENKVPELITRAYQFRNAAKHLLVKGETDRIVCQGAIIDCIDSPKTEALEAIGGTGDTVTGIVTALITSGIPVDQAAGLACRVNRLAGYYAQPDPATQIADIVDQIPKALEETLGKE